MSKALYQLREFIPHGLPNLETLIVEGGDFDDELYEEVVHNRLMEGVVEFAITEGGPPYGLNNFEYVYGIDYQTHIS
jgi:hypothetical protein